MTDARIRETLKERMKEALPGEDAQMRMAPDFRKPLSFYTEEIKKAKKAAVMILLFRDHEERIATLLIKRHQSGIHASQIALPGGRVEPDDKDIFETAVRETEEEVSAKREHIELLGSLSPLYIPPSRFYLTPVVGWYHGSLNFVMAESEITNLYIVPVSLFHDEHLRYKDRFLTHTGMSTMAPAYRIGDESMWGATAMIFSEFSELCRDLI